MEKIPFAFLERNFFLKYSLICVGIKFRHSYDGALLMDEPCGGIQETREIWTR
jgi:hypothetical protein